jgi:pyruvate/2-oxoglutarate dehydrogenase complex dihydrolipoamide dehydrogenase (E3) component
MEPFDAIVIGTGQAGPSLAVRLANAGRKVAILERARFGGTCVNTGCIPTKAMVASARAAWTARNAAQFGVQIGGELRVDMKRVKERKDQISGDANAGVTKWLETTPGVTVIRGQGRFSGPRTVRVGERELTAGQVFINVGGRAIRPPLPGLDAVPYWTNSSIMAVDFLPPHLIILGGGYVALEFAQMYRRFGSEVTVLESSPRLLPREDEDISAEIRAILEAEGVLVICGAEAVKVSGAAGAIEIALQGREAVRGSHLLVAVGRQPNTADLGLREAGVETDARGYIKVDDELRTTADGVWALGDCNGKGAFTHTSYNDYEIVAANLLDGEHRKVSDRVPAYALYIDPPLGRAGMSEAEARTSGRQVLVARMPMSRVSRARERSETRGFMRALVDAKTKRLLGASLLGINADEVIHLFIDVMTAQAPYTVITRAMHIHPTVAELIPTLLEGLEPLEQAPGRQ